MGEVVCVGDDIRVIVVRNANGVVGLGFEAPGIHVWREELQKKEFIKQDAFVPVATSRNSGGTRSLDGTVTRVDDRGFGFIYSAGIEEEIFFHASDVEGDFNEMDVEDEVEFLLRTNNKGLGAVEVKVKVKADV